MVKRESALLVFLCGFFLISMSFVFAVGDDFKFHPTIDIKASKGEIYVVRVSDALTAKGIRSIVFEIGSDGRENEQVGTDAEMVNVMIYRVTNASAYFKNEEYITEKNAGTFATNNVITLNVRENIYNALTSKNETEEVVEEENETVVEEEPEGIVEETVEEEVAEGDAVTGNVISGIVDFSKSNVVYFIIGLVIIAGVVVFFMTRGRVHFGGGNLESQPRTIKLSELRGQSRDSRLSFAEKKLEKAEGELREAREQISKIKNEKSELSEAEEQFKKAKERLDSLKGD